MQFGVLREISEFIAIYPDHAIRLNSVRFLPPFVENGFFVSPTPPPFFSNDQKSKKALPHFTKTRNALNPKMRDL